MSTQTMRMLTERMADYRDPVGQCRDVLRATVDSDQALYAASRMRLTARLKEWLKHRGLAEDIAFLDSEIAEEFVELCGEFELYDVLRCSGKKQAKLPQLFTKVNHFTARTTEFRARIEMYEREMLNAHA